MPGDRSIGIAVDYSPSSKSALKWALDNLADKGDRIVVIHINQNKEPESGQSQLWDKAGSRNHLFYIFIPLSVYVFRQ